MHEILTIMPSVSAIFRYIYTKKDYSLPVLKGQGKREKTLKSEKTEFRGRFRDPGASFGSLYFRIRGDKDPE